jgi:LuxR family transcriptional regulator, maltose regulon positive regulatory protein
MRDRIQILSSRLTPTQKPKHFLERPVYLELAKTVVAAKATALTAPAGCGKTTFLSWLAALPEQAKLQPGTVNNFTAKYKTAWHTLREDDRSPAFFLAYLLEAIDMVIPGFAHNAQRMLYSIPDSQQNYTSVIDQLYQELWLWEEGQKGGRVLLILDDLHLIEDSTEVLKLLERLVVDSPPFFLFCFSGRTSMQALFAQLSLKHKTAEIGYSQLGFSDEDARLFFNDLYGLDVNTRQVEDINSKIAGWPAGLVITAHALEGRSSADYDKIISTMLKRKLKVFSHLAEEALQRLDHDIRSFIMRASLLKSLTPEGARVILKCNKASVYLETLHDKGLFLELIIDEQGYHYRLHPLFADYLGTLAAHELSAEQITAIHLSAADYHEEKSELGLALEHLWLAGEDKAAVAMIKKYAQNLINRGYIEELNLWLNKVDAAGLGEDPFFLYLKGFILQHREPASAIHCFERSAAKFSHLGNKPLLVRNLIYMCTIYSLQNRVDKVAEVSAQIPVITALTTDAWARGVLTVSSLCREVWKDNLRMAQRLFKLAGRFPLEPDWQWARLAYACMAYYRLGKLDLARRVIEEALHLPVVKDNDIFKGMALVLYNVVHYSNDDDAMVDKVYLELWEIAERYDSAYYKAFCERARAAQMLHQCRWEEAEEHYRASLYFFTRSGNDAMVEITKLDLARLDTCRGQTDRALVNARLAWHKLSKMKCGQGLVEQGQTLLGLVAREAGDLSLAEKALTESAKVSKLKGAAQSYAGTLFHLSLLYHLQGKKGKGDILLRQSLTIAERMGYKVFWDWHPPTAVRQLAYAVDNGLCRSYAKHLQDYWLRKDHTAVSTGTTGELTNSAAISPETLITCFGNFSVEVNGKKLPTKAWQTKKVQAVFKYLLINHKTKVNREQLASMLWPVSESESAAASMRVSLSRLRKALSCFEEEGLNLKGLLGEEYGQVFFNPEGDVKVDFIEFERLIKEAEKAITAGDTGRAVNYYEEAVDLCKGDLFSEDPYEEWIIPERERLDILRLNALVRLGGIYFLDLSHDRTGLNKAQHCFEEALRLNPYREDIYLHLVKAYLAAGEKAEAIRVYKRCALMLQQEFKLEPGKALQDIMRDLNAGQ